jgi:hypothetical protein
MPGNVCSTPLQYYSFPVEWKYSILIASLSNRYTILAIAFYIYPDSADGDMGGVFANVSNLLTGFSQ